MSFFYKQNCRGGYSRLFIWVAYEIFVKLNSTPLSLPTVLGIPGAARCTVALSTMCRCCAVWLKSLLMHALLCCNAQQIQSTEPWLCHPDDLCETIIPVLLLCWDLHVDMVMVCKEHIEYDISELSLPNM